MEDEFLASGWHWTFGWVRRPSMDNADGYCYEAPDGDLIYSSRPTHRHAAFLEAWRDADTKEDYVTFSWTPRKAPARFRA
jgi:hypothetical protein